MRNTPLRRAALVAAGALLGLTGLVGVASPASATGRASAKLSCEPNGEQRQEWRAGMSSQASGDVRVARQTFWQGPLLAGLTWQGV